MKSDPTYIIQRRTRGYFGIFKVRKGDTIIASFHDSTASDFQNHQRATLLVQALIKADKLMSKVTKP